MSQSGKHISVVSIEKIERQTIERLCESPLVESVAVAPTHFGDLLSDGSIKFMKSVKNLEVLRSKMTFNSVQGIFYLLEADDEDINQLITNRIKSVVKICREFAIRKIVVGAPNFRNHDLIWNFMMSELREHSLADGLQVLVENLCVPGRLESHDAFGCSSPSNYGSGYILDISNALACDYHMDKGWISNGVFDMVHASGRMHKAVCDSEDALELVKYLDSSGQTSEIIWEFDYKSVEEILRALTTTLDLVKSVNH